MASDSDSVDSDTELQEAFSRGELKPGLHATLIKEKTHINDVVRMKQKLEEIEQSLPWLERLAESSDPVDKKLVEEDAIAEDDFKREMKFYRQAQSSVLEALPKLQALGIPTKRPEDYFAQMAKTDDHMKKVREKLLAKQLSQERSEKAKKLRELRKYGKKVQVEVLQKRQKEKREMMEAVKKYRKGQQDKLDFLEGDKMETHRQGSGKKKEQHKPGKKREMKNKKFGFGGQKKRGKQNTAGSAADMSGFNIRKHGSRPGHVKKVKAPSKNRLGKRRRQKMKSQRR